MLKSRDNTRELRANMVFVPHDMVELRDNTLKSQRNTRESREIMVKSRANMVSVPANKGELSDNTLFSRRASLESRPNIVQKAPAVHRESRTFEASTTASESTTPTKTHQS